MALVLSPWYSTSLIFIWSFKFRAIVRALYMAEVSRPCASFHLSISGWRALRYTLRISCESNAIPFFFSCSFTSSPVSDTIPISWPGVPSTAITSPWASGRLFTLRKNSLRLFLNRTSTTSKMDWPWGNSILASQSNMLSLLHPPEPQAPLLRQPLGVPLLTVSHPRPLVHPWQLIVRYWLLVLRCKKDSKFNIINGRKKRGQRCYCQRARQRVGRWAFLRARKKDLACGALSATGLSAFTPRPSTLRQAQGDSRGCGVIATIPHAWPP